MSNTDPYKIDLPVEQRKQMYKELLELDSQARKEVNEKYPIDLSKSDSDIHNQIVDGNQILPQYREAFGKKYNLTSKQIAGLQAEGFEQEWKG